MMSKLPKNFEPYRTKFAKILRHEDSLTIHDMILILDFVDEFQAVNVDYLSGILNTLIKALEQED